MGAFALKDELLLDDDWFVDMEEPTLFRSDDDGLSAFSMDKISFPGVATVAVIPSEAIRKPIRRASTRASNPGDIFSS